MDESASPATATAGETAPEPLLLLRLVVLALLIAAANAWASHHFGWSWRSVPLVTAGLAVLATLLAWFPEQRGAAESLRRRVLGRLLDWEVLGTLVVVFVALTGVVSSITVVADGVGGARRVRVEPEGAGGERGATKTLEGGDALVRFPRLTTPFGRAFAIEVTGYRRHSIDLLPWRGAVVRLGRDLKRPPSLLVRLPLAAFPARERGVLAVGGGRVAERIALDGHGAVVLGPALPIPAEWVDRWRRELRVAGLEALEDEALLAWMSPLEGPADRIRPGEELVLRIENQVGNAVACARIEVGDHAQQQVELAPPSRAPGCEEET